MSHPTPDKRIKYLKLDGTCTGEGRLRVASDEDLALYDKMAAHYFEDGMTCLDHLSWWVDGAPFGFPGERVYITTDEPYGFPGEDC